MAFVTGEYILYVRPEYIRIGLVMTAFKTWVQQWGALIIATLALLLSGIVFYLDDMHYRELTEPYTKHEETSDMLVELNSRIDLSRERIEQLEDDSSDNAKYVYYLNEAENLRDIAETAWAEGDYSGANDAISRAHGLLDRTLPAEPANGMLIGLIIAVAVMVVSVVTWLVMRTRMVSQRL